MGERYPYPTPEYRDMTAIPDGKLPDLDRSKSFLEEGFDLNEQLQKVGGPVVEIAGTTQSGYEVLGDQAILPEVPLFTNAQRAAKSVDRKLDIVMDGSRLPLTDDSIGVLLVSGLTIVTEAGGLDPQDYSDVDAAYEEYKTYKGPLRGLERKNVRIATLEEAARVLKPSGILIWQSELEGDSEVAKLNGLELRQRVHGQFEAEFQGEVHTFSPENSAIFQKLE